MSVIACVLKHYILTLFQIIQSNSSPFLPTT